MILNFLFEKFESLIVSDEPKSINHHSANSNQMRPGQLKPYYVYRFLRWKLGDKSPLTAVAKVTNECELKCDHCPWWRREIDEASIQEWLKALKKAREMGVTHLILEGGEPTSRKDINQIISYAKKLGMLVMIITNGINDLSQYKPDNFWISIDGLGDIHDTLRGKGVFKRVVQNIKRNPDTPKMVLCTISKTNVHQLEDIAAFFSEITDGVWFNFMYPYKGSKDIALSLSEQKETASKIIKLKDEHNIINSCSYLRSVGKKSRKEDCRSFLTLLIDTDLTFHQGCTVEQIEECRCEVCNLGCYGELTQALKLRIDALKFLQKSTGLEDKLLWLG